MMNALFSTRPKPRRPEGQVLVNNWRASVIKRSWVTPHQLNILGVLYSSVYMGPTQDVKTVPHDAFTIAGIAVSVDDMDELCDRGWVARIKGSEGFKYRLQTQGSLGYDLLYYAERHGVYPPQAPVPLSPEEIVAKRRATTIDPSDPTRPRSLMDKEEARQVEVMRALTQILENQAQLDRQMQDLRARQDNGNKMFQLTLDRLEEQYQRGKV